MTDLSADFGRGGKQFSIALEPADPTKMTTEDLKKQLTGMGLTCPASREEMLQEYIEEVTGSFPKGGLGSFGIRTTKEPGGLLANADTGATQESSVGDWTLRSFGFNDLLEVVQNPIYFDWLQKNQADFAGVVAPPQLKTGKYDTIAAVKSMFISVGDTVSSAVVKGINASSIESALSNAIKAVTKDTTDYNESGSRVFFLVDNYENNDADGIGVATVDWTLQISNYKEKKKEPKHAVLLTMNARAVLYDNPGTLARHYNKVNSHFKLGLPYRDASGNPIDQASAPGIGANFGPGGGGPVTGKVKIFKNDPPATIATFNASLPVNASSKDAQVIVMYSPDLRPVGSIDNLDSDVETTFQKAVTTGFTFTSTQTISASATVEGSVGVVTASATVGFSLGFSESWNKGETTTISFDCPAKTKAFLYQGTIKARILILDSLSGKVRWGDEAHFMTDVLTTSKTPLANVTPVGS